MSRAGALPSGSYYVPDALRDEVRTTSDLVRDDIPEKPRGGETGLACRAPALMTHHDGRSARLRIQIDEQHLLTPCHGQAVGEHHHHGCLTDAAATIGDGNELGH